MKLRSTDVASPTVFELNVEDSGQVEIHMGITALV